MNPPLCLSVRQPWAWAILNCGKDIENRNWPTKFRGPVLLHASKGCTRNEFEDAIWVIGGIVATDPRYDAIVPPELPEVSRGGIVGRVEIVDCVAGGESPWFSGNFGFVLRNAKPLPFTPCKGALGFFRCPDDAWKSLMDWERSGAALEVAP